MSRLDAVESFWARVDKTDGCWKWTGGVNGTNGSGYGVTTFWGRSCLAHRVSFALAHGYWPAGMVIMHRCDNTLCVNPDHLRLGTQVDNMRDMMSKGRAVRYDRHGTRNPRCKLTTEQVEQIMVLRHSGVTLLSIAGQFGIGTSQVHRISNGKSWSK